MIASNTPLKKTLNEFSSMDFKGYQALIFDLDGTLVDSQDAIVEVFRPWCRRHKLDLDQVLEGCRGARIIDFLPTLAPHLDAQAEFNYLSAREAQTTVGLVAIGGAKRFLSALSAQQITWGIATSCPLAVGSLRLQATGFQIPEVFVTSEQVSRGKPEPEHFQTAAHQLGASASRCLAFEDSNSGVRSALAAGCDVVVVGTHCQIEHPRIKARVNNYWALLNQLNADQVPLLKQASAEASVHTSIHISTHSKVKGSLISEDLQ